MRAGYVGVALAVLLLAVGMAQEKKTSSVSFKKDVYPLIKDHCLPCHSEDNFNPSELSLDSYDKLMEGGKHGAPLVAGKPKESLIVSKIGLRPPFGDRMPLNTKKKISEGTAKWLSDKEVKIIVEWIDQGAKNN